MIALPREAREANKINGLRNRLEKKGSLFCKAFQERYPNDATELSHERDRRRVASRCYSMALPDTFDGADEPASSILHSCPAIERRECAAEENICLSQMSADRLIAMPLPHGTSRPSSPHSIVF
ncbi:hypothetical protein BRAS3843_520222 [Bradyrhizobium sp. STM 3843]|nr:hypothetical protein BRAS3843_520222 [Bradyrhizobium sp. STM 3843]